MNNDYIIMFDENGSPYIEHAYGNHKYLMKIGEGLKARYFYTQEEIAAYQRALHNTFKQRTQNTNKAINSVETKPGTINNTGKKTVNSINKTPHTNKRPIANTETMSDKMKNSFKLSDNQVQQIRQKLYSGKTLSKYELSALNRYYEKRRKNGNKRPTGRTRNVTGKATPIVKKDRLDDISEPFEK